MNEELRKEILRLLNAAGVVSAASPPVAVVFLDHALQDATAFPYGVLGEATVTADDTSDADGALVRFPVSVFSKYKGGRETALIADAMRAALHHQEDSLVLTTCEAVTMYVEGVQEDPTADEGKTRESVVTVSVLVYGITAGTA